MPSVSKKQQKFMGIVRAIQKGEADPSDFNKDAQDAAKKMKKSSVKKYAKTKHKGLPNKKVNEAQVTKSIMTNPNNRKLYFTLVDGNDVKLIDAKTWLKSSLKDVSSTVNQDKVIKSIVRKQKQFNKKVEWNQWKSKNKPSFVEQMKWLMDNGFVKNVNKGGIKEERDYKAEYKKFQSSTKAKKYRAELNKYNRQKGTYGNGDGKDASHKGGKIVGFEAESKNRGRAEKSRLKKEINDYVGSVIDETINENPAAIAAAQRMVVQSKGKKISVNTARNSRYKDKDPAAHKKAKSMFSRLLDKFRKKNESQMLLQMAKQLKEADESVNEIKVWDLNEKCWKGYEKKGMKTMFGKRYPNCVKKKKKSESVNEKVLGGKDVTSGIDKNTKITFDKRIPNKKLAGKTFVVVKKGINTFNVRPDGSGNERDTKKLDAPTILQLLKNKTIRKIVNSKGKKLNKESVKEAVYKFRGYTNTQMDELDAMLARAGYKGTPDFNKMTWTTKDKNPKIARIIKSKGGKKIKESVNEAPKIDSRLHKGLKKIQDDSYKLLANYRTVPGIQKLVKAWMDGLHRSMKQLGIMKESKELTKIDTMLKNQIKKIGKADKKAGMELMKLYKKHWVEFSIKAKQHMNEAFAIQYKKDKRYLTRKELFDKKPLKFKTEDEAKSMLNGLDHKYRTNYKIVKIKEGTCGYGVGGKLGDEPAGPHLLKKKKKKDDVGESKRRSRLRAISKAKKTRKMNLFSKSQLDTLRKQYSTIKGINPSSPTYKKLTYTLDSLPLPNLKQLEKAKIPFVSGLARNRVYRAKKFGSTTGG